MPDHFASAGVLRFSVRTEEFQISFAEPFRIISLGTLITLEVMCLSAGAAGEWWLLLGVLPALTAILSAISVAIIVYRYRFSVGPDGISCYDFWCQPLTTRWEDMQSVSRISLPGIAYARVTTNDRFRALWLPLFVDDLESLRELVTLHAGGSHPLSVLLQREDAGTI
ncbi:MAG: hypothetical protein KDA75_09355 [Planctomycetaceae bacterium]|nr:hypothetical protein [Planctomycetaceae bacterium]